MFTPAKPSLLNTLAHLAAALDSHDGQILGPVVNQVDNPPTADSRSPQSALIGKLYHLDRNTMSAREELHQLVDSLAEDHGTAVRQYIEDLRDDDVIDRESLAAIREGLRDIQHGRVMDVQEYRRTRGL